VVIQRLNFPPILQDNEEAYFRYLEGITSSVDERATMLLVKRSQGIGIRISPSSPGNFNNILDEMKRFHTMIGIQVDFSKSMKAGANIAFQINFEAT